MKKRHPLLRYFSKEFSKTLLIMRLTIVFFLLGILRTNADTKSQPNISLNIKNTKIENVILVQDPDDDDTARIKEKPLFDTVYRVGVNENLYSREWGRKVYLLKGAKVDINKIIAGEIDKRKNHP